MLRGIDALSGEATLSSFHLPSETGSVLKGKKMGTNSFLLAQAPFQKGVGMQ